MHEELGLLYARREAWGLSGVGVVGSVRVVGMAVGGSGRELWVRLSDVMFCGCRYDDTLSPGAGKTDG